MRQFLAALRSARTRTAFALLALSVSVFDCGIAWSQSDPLQGIRIAPEADVSYERRRDYGDWIRMNEPYNRCFSVRDQVLEDESVKSRFKYESPAQGWRCTVTAGRWKDQYTGKWITDPGEIDIDHMVPLKEAHISGAHRWSKAKRREYANYLRDPRHLIAVSSSANRSKSDKDPAEWMPPHAAYHCTYLQHWIAVKRRWDLAVDEIEAEFIRRTMADC